eukprot:GILJ01006848.1.p1 GENE.GILJ01006848.1~~GILJ01006848.1.p1  ORF type:complete len:2332 (+),score=340.34 GILJ01006848.1:41-7036(+)
MVKEVPFARFSSAQPAESIEDLIDDSPPPVLCKIVPIERIKMVDRGVFVALFFFTVATCLLTSSALRGKTVRSDANDFVVSLLVSAPIFATVFASYWYIRVPSTLKILAVGAGSLVIPLLSLPSLIAGDDISSPSSVFFLFVIPVCGISSTIVFLIRKHGHSTFQLSSCGRGVFTMGFCGLFMFGFVLFALILVTTDATYESRTARFSIALGTLALPLCFLYVFCWLFIYRMFFAEAIALARVTFTILIVTFTAIVLALFGASIRSTDESNNVLLYVSLVFACFIFIAICMPTYFLTMEVRKRLCGHAIFCVFVPLLLLFVFSALSANQFLSELALLFAVISPLAAVVVTTGSVLSGHIDTSRVLSAFTCISIFIPLGIILPLYQFQVVEFAVSATLSLFLAVLAVVVYIFAYRRQILHLIKMKFKPLIPNVDIKTFPYKPLSAWMSYTAFAAIVVIILSTIFLGHSEVPQKGIAIALLLIAPVVYIAWYYIGISEVDVPLSRTAQLIKQALVWSGALIPLCIFLPLLTVADVSAQFAWTLKSLLAGSTVAILITVGLVEMRRLAKRYGHILYAMVSACCCWTVLLPFGTFIPCMVAWGLTNGGNASRTISGIIGMTLFICMATVVTSSVTLNHLFKRMDYEKRAKQIIRFVATKLREIGVRARLIHLRTVYDQFSVHGKDKANEWLYTGQYVFWKEVAQDDHDADVSMEIVDQQKLLRAEAKRKRQELQRKRKAREEQKMKEMVEKEMQRRAQVKQKIEQEKKAMMEKEALERQQKQEAKELKAAKQRELKQQQQQKKMESQSKREEDKRQNKALAVEGEQHPLLQPLSRQSLPEETLLMPPRISLPLSLEETARQDVDESGSPVSADLDDPQARIRFLLGLLPESPLGAPSRSTSGGQSRRNSMFMPGRIESPHMLPMPRNPLNKHSRGNSMDRSPSIPHLRTINSLQTTCEPHPLEADVHIVSPSVAVSEDGSLHAPASLPPLRRPSIDSPLPWFSHTSTQEQTAPPGSLLLPRSKFSPSCSASASPSLGSSSGCSVYNALFEDDTLSARSSSKEQPTPLELLKLKLDKGAPDVNQKELERIRRQRQIRTPFEVPSLLTAMNLKALQLTDEPISPSAVAPQSILSPMSDLIDLRSLPTSPCGEEDSRRTQIKASLFGRLPNFTVDVGSSDADASNPGSSSDVLSVVSGRQSQYRQRQHSGRLVSGPSEINLLVNSAPLELLSLSQSHTSLFSSTASLKPKKKLYNLHKAAKRLLLDRRTVERESKSDWRAEGAVDTVADPSQNVLRRVVSQVLKRPSKRVSLVVNIAKKFSQLRRLAASNNEACKSAAPSLTRWGSFLSVTGRDMAKARWKLLCVKIHCLVRMCSLMYGVRVKYLAVDTITSNVHSRKQWLDRVFLRFATWVNHDALSIGMPHYYSFLREVNLIDRKFTKGEADILYIKLTKRFVMNSAARPMDRATFEEALYEIANRRYRALYAMNKDLALNALIANFLFPNLANMFSVQRSVIEFSEPLVSVAVSAFYDIEEETDDSELEVDLISESSDACSESEASRFEIERQSLLQSQRFEAERQHQAEATELLLMAAEEERERMRLRLEQEYVVFLVHSMVDVVHETERTVRIASEPTRPASRSAIVTLDSTFPTIITFDPICEPIVPPAIEEVAPADEFSPVPAVRVRTKSTSRLISLRNLLSAPEVPLSPTCDPLISKSRQPFSFKQTLIKGCCNNRCCVCLQRTGRKLTRFTKAAGLVVKRYGRIAVAKIQYGLERATVGLMWAAGMPARFMRRFMSSVVSTMKTMASMGRTDEDLESDHENESESGDESTEEVLDITGGDRDSHDHVDLDFDSVQESVPAAAQEITQAPLSPVKTPAKSFFAAAVLAVATKGKPGAICRPLAPTWKLTVDTIIDTIYEREMHYSNSNQKVEDIRLRHTFSNYAAIGNMVNDFIGMISICFRPNVDWPFSQDSTVKFVSTLPMFELPFDFAFPLFFWFSCVCAFAYPFFAIPAVSLAKRGILGTDVNGQPHKLFSKGFFHHMFLNVLGASLYLPVIKTMISVLACDYSEEPWTLLRDGMSCWDGVHYLYVVASFLAIFCYYPISTFMYPNLQFQDKSLDLKMHPSFLILLAQCKLIIAGTTNFFPSKKETSLLFSIAGVVFLILALTVIYGQPCMVRKANIWYGLLFLLGAWACASSLYQNDYELENFPGYACLIVGWSVLISVSLYVYWRRFGNPFHWSKSSANIDSDGERCELIQIRTDNVDAADQGPETPIQRFRRTAATVMMKRARARSSGGLSIEELNLTPAPSLLLLQQESASQQSSARDQSQESAEAKQQGAD